MENKENNLNESAQVVPPGLEKQHRSKIFLILLLGSFFVILAVFVFGLKSSGSDTGSQLTKINALTKDEAITPTPMPFSHLTIPYLRTKTYESRLGDLDEAYTGSNYTAYFTSYTSDGLKVNGLLTIPDGGPSFSAQDDSRKYPAIIFVHGYIPPAVYQTNGEAYSAYVDYLARSGFVVFKIDLRGHGNSEGEAGGGYYGSDYVSDILHAYSALENSEFVNRGKIGLWGHSMSGNAVLRSMAVKPEIPAGVIWAGAVYTYVDMQKYRINDASYQPPVNNTERQTKRRELFEKHGSPSATSIFWKQVAPTNYLSDLKGAISLHHAVDDTVVNIGYSRDLDELLDKTNVVHELNEYSSGGHNISGSSFNAAMQRTVEFFKENL